MILEIIAGTIGKQLRSCFCLHECTPLTNLS
jgi:hypothetical protein